MDSLLSCVIANAASCGLFYAQSYSTLASVSIDGFPYTSQIHQSQNHGKQENICGKCVVVCGYYITGPRGVSNWVIISRYIFDCSHLSHLISLRLG